AVRAQQHVDNHTVLNHRFEHGTSNQLYKGILRDEGRTVFNGKIYVQPAAQLTNAYQLNRNLLLSPKAQAYTRPQLEIYADDVRCTHGASVGPLDQEQLFYLLSRGIPRAQAVSLLAHGFVEDVLEAVPDNVRDRLRQHLNDYFVATEIN
ncbi:MAG: SufD family Fe-S cluster assembly protein, partial [Planctomycetes bacterium]|nr:SufD family Fe-S cluster assembly protein [Planctomycetota bacterium]